MSTVDHSSQILALAQRLDRLLEATKRLAEENQKLKQAVEQIQSERNQLQGKNDLARTRVESMIQRLNALEQSHD